MDQICSYLTLDQILNFREALTRPKWNCAFWIRDVDGRLEYFTSLTPENIRTYREIQKELGLSLIMAIRKKKFAESRSLINRLEVPINLRDQMGYTALIRTVSINWIEGVKLLLSRSDLDVNLATSQKYTALMVASGYGYLEIVELLLSDSRIQVNLQDRDGDTALMWAANSQSSRLVQLLLSGPDINASILNRKGRSAINKAERKGNFLNAEIIREHLEKIQIEIVC